MRNWISNLASAIISGLVVATFAFSMLRETPDSPNVIVAGQVSGVGYPILSTVTEKVMDQFFPNLSKNERFLKGYEILEDAGLSRSTLLQNYHIENENKYKSYEVLIEAKDTIFFVASGESDRIASLSGDINYRVKLLPGESISISVISDGLVMPGYSNDKFDTVFSVGGEYIEIQPLANFRRYEAVETKLVREHSTILLIFAFIGLVTSPFVLVAFLVNYFAKNNLDLLSKLYDADSIAIGSVLEKHLAKKRTPKSIKVQQRISELIGEGELPSSTDTTEKD